MKKTIYGILLISCVLMPEISMAAPVQIGLDTNQLVSLSYNPDTVATSWSLEYGTNLNEWVSYGIISHTNTLHWSVPAANTAAYYRVVSSTNTPVSDLNPPVSFLSRGSRLLGWDILDVTPESDFGSNFAAVADVGVDFLALHVEWDDLEPGLVSGGGDYQDPSNTLSVISGFCASNNLKLSLTIRPIDATGKTIPSDLNSTRFNDPLMADRFIQLLTNHVFQLVDPNLLTSLQVGNEIDLFDANSEHPDFWSDYGAFLYGIRSYCDTILPSVDVGFTVTRDGIFTGPYSGYGIFTNLANTVHVLGVTYYALDPGFQIKAPTQAEIQSDLQAITDHFPNHPIYLQELGYQTSLLNGGSEREQARFYRDFFQVWDAMTNRIHLVNIIRFNNVSVDRAYEMAGPYSVNEGDASYENFVEYLRTLGVRTQGNPGHLKQAYHVIRHETNRRGWGTP